ncbi:MAG: hypothetical protein ICV79_27645, partial [Flavisolibacter sp.]|nr:hypothetical protein [Flavisolibacter sp.]
CINPERTNTPMRQRAFGIEPENSLLSPKSVALLSLGVLLSNETGQILDITTQFAKTAIATDLYSDELVEYK